MAIPSRERNETKKNDSGWNRVAPNRMPPLPDLLVEKRGEGREGGILRYGRDEKDTV